MPKRTKTKKKEKDDLYIDVDTLLEALNLQRIINIDDLIEKEIDGEQTTLIRVLSKDLIDLIDNDPYFNADNCNKFTGKYPPNHIRNLDLN